MNYRSLFILCSLLPAVVSACALDAVTEYRYCDDYSRDSRGRLTRSAAVLRAYKALHPCPVTGLSAGACEGWAIQHIIPRASGGCDAVHNLMWLPEAVKSCAGKVCVDRWERRYYLLNRLHGVIKDESD